MSLNQYGIEKYIRTDKIYPETKLAKRLVPISKKTDATTQEFRTYRIPIVSLRERMRNVDTDCLFGVKNAELLSYLPTELPFSWKDPNYYKDDLNTIEEACAIDPEQDSNEVFIFATFNMLKKEDFYDIQTEKWVIPNSTALENLIDCTCILTNTSALLFDYKKLYNIEDKRKTIKGTEEGLYPHINIANEGPKISEKGKLIAGENQTLPFNCLIEWFAPYFDNERGGHELFTLKGKGRNTTFEDTKWIDVYLECLPKKYRGEKRFTLMYRRYDERKENELVKEYTLKLLFVTYFHQFFDFNNPDDIPITYLIDFILLLKDNEKKYININEYLDLIEYIFKNRKEYYKTLEDGGFKGNILKKEIKPKLEKYKDKLLEDIKPELVLGDEPEIFQYEKGYDTFIEKFEKLKGYKSLKDKYNKLNGDKKTNMMSIVLLGLNIYNDDKFRQIYHYIEIHKKLLCEYNGKLHNMRRKIFARVMKGGNNKDTVWSFVSFKEPAK